jgi:hypothetical protein
MLWYTNLHFRLLESFRCPTDFLSQIVNMIGHYFGRVLMKKRKEIIPPSASLPHLLLPQLLRSELENPHAAAALRCC